MVRRAKYLVGNDASAEATSFILCPRKLSEESQNTTTGRPRELFDGVPKKAKEYQGKVIFFGSHIRMVHYGNSIF